VDTARLCCDVRFSFPGDSFVYLWLLNAPSTSAIVILCVIKGVGMRAEGDMHKEKWVTALPGYLQKVKPG